jgi:hypothetical protein
MVENTNFLGGDLSMDDGGGGLEAKDPAGCAAECKKRSKCTHWSFVAEWKVNCYLKEKLGERSDFEGGVAGTFGANCGQYNSLHLCLSLVKKCFALYSGL